VRRGSLPVLLARLPAAAAEAGAGLTAAGQKGAGAEVRIGAPFTDRLVAKFGLPVAGWRGQSSDTMGEDALAREEFSDRADEEPGGHA
jgi:hypothetical protein